MDLEALAERDEDGFSEGIGLDGLGPRGVGLWDVEYVHGKGDREVEGVVCDFVDHDLWISLYNGQYKRDISGGKYALFQ